MADYAKFEFTPKPLVLPDIKPAVTVGGSMGFWFCKRCFDIGMSLMLMLVLVPAIYILWLINPFYNKGPLFYVQTRMGRDCQPFRTLKFRSMTEAAEIRRGHDDPLELDRITPLGRFLRKSRIDELPQILNVLKGDMSLIGPRPDFYEHACMFLRTVPDYKYRHIIRPGISGLAQIDLGYAVGSEATRAKVRADLAYIKQAGFAQEARLVLQTIRTVVTLKGA